MQQFIEKNKHRIVGMLSGFDRLVFRGSLQRLNYCHWDQGLGAMVACGREQYLWQNQILFKDYGPFVPGQLRIHMKMRRDPIWVSPAHAAHSRELGTYRVVGKNHGPRSHCRAKLPELPVPNGLLQFQISL